MDDNHPVTVLELARSISEGATVEKPDFEAGLAEIERFASAWKARSVLVSEHVVSATQCLLGTTARNIAQNNDGSSFAEEELMLSSLAAAATRCVEHELGANRYHWAARALRETLRSESTEDRNGVDELNPNLFTEAWQRCFSSEATGTSRKENKLATERNCERTRCLIEGGCHGPESIDDLAGSSKAGACESDADPILGDASAPVAIGHDWQQDLSRIRCPVSGVLMQHPVRNRECMHSYEKEGIEQLIRSHNRLRPRERLSGKHHAPCPVAGCVAIVSLASLEPDTEIMLIMERLQRRQARLQNRRTSIGSPKAVGLNDPIEDATP